MVTELLRFNCHILGNNKHQDNITPEILFQKYKDSKSDLIISGVKVEVISCNWAAGGKTSILTKLKRID